MLEHEQTGSTTETPVGNASLKAPFFRQDIQGLRGLAVFAVVLFHASSSLLPGGFVGVDMFFVISGYVIGGLIRRDLMKGQFSFVSFYRRRILRLYPALFATLLVTLTAGAWILSPVAFRELGRTTVSTVLFLSNIDFYKLIGYFNNQANLKPLLHMWSLAVEEQFYLVFPALLMLAWKLSPRRVPLIIAGIFASSLLIEVLVTGRSTQAAFYWPVCRTFEFATGAAVAWSPWTPSPRRVICELAACGGLLLLVLSLTIVDDRMVFPGVAALAPCIGIAGLLYPGSRTTLIGRMLGSPLPRVLGDASYSIYLWHWPVMVFTRHLLFGRVPVWIALGGAMVSIGLGLLSRKFIEQPFILYQKQSWPVFRVAAAAMLVPVAAGCIVYVNKGFPDRFSPEVRRIYAGAEDSNKFRARCHGNDAHIISYGENCVFGDLSATPEIAVWGDSSGAELSVALGEILRPQRRSMIEVTSSGCPPTIGYPPERPPCIRRNSDALQSLAHDPRIITVLVTSNYAGYRGAGWSRFTDGLRLSVQTLRAAGKQVDILLPFPVYEFDPPSAVGWLARRGQDLGGFTLPREEVEKQSGDAQRMLIALAKEFGAEMIPATDVLCGPSFCPAYETSAGMLYMNPDHLSVNGARYILLRSGIHF